MGANRIDKEYREPVYTIGIVSRMLKVCPATLRIWERKRLIRPSRIGRNRFYSRSDLDTLEYIKELLQKRGINIEGVRSILSTTRCWEVKRCKPKEREACSVYLKYAPRIIR